MQGVHGGAGVCRSWRQSRSGLRKTISFWMRGRRAAQSSVEVSMLGYISHVHSMSASRLKLSTLKSCGCGGGGGGDERSEGEAEAAPPTPQPLTSCLSQLRWCSTPCVSWRTSGVGLTRSTKPPSAERWKTEDWPALGRRASSSDAAESRTKAARAGCAKRRSTGSRTPVPPRCRASGGENSMIEACERRGEEGVASKPRKGRQGRRAVGEGGGEPARVHRSRGWRRRGWIR